MSNCVWTTNDRPYFVGREKGHSHKHKGRRCKLMTGQDWCSLSAAPFDVHGGRGPWAVRRGGGVDREVNGARCAVGRGWQLPGQLLVVAAARQRHVSPLFFEQLFRLSLGRSGGAVLLVRLALAGPECVDHKLAIQRVDHLWIVRPGRDRKLWKIQLSTIDRSQTTSRRHGSQSLSRSGGLGNFLSTHAPPAVRTGPVGCR